MAATVTVNDLLDGQVSLDLECLDRVYLNAYVPNLQVGGQVVSFLTAHLGYPIPSPAIFDKIGTAFRRAVGRFANEQHIPMVRFTKTDRKIEKMQPYIAAQAATGRSGVAAIGVAQEYANVFTGTQRPTSNGAPWFAFAKADRRVTCYYFYLWDEEFGPAFLKVCAYFPTRPRSGSMATSGLNARPAVPGSGSVSCPTGSPLPTTPPGCRRSATGSGRPPSRCSPSAGSRCCRCR